MPASETPASGVALTHATGTPVVDNLDIPAASPRGPAPLQNVWLLEQLAHFRRKMIPGWRIHPRDASAHGQFTVMNDISSYTLAKVFSEIGKQRPMFSRFAIVWPHANLAYRAGRDRLANSETT